MCKQPTSLTKTDLAFAIPTFHLLHSRRTEGVSCARASTAHVQVDDHTITKMYKLSMPIKYVEIRFLDLSLIKQGIIGSHLYQLVLNSTLLCAMLTPYPWLARDLLQTM